MSTEGFWQRFYAPDEVREPPYVDRYPARVAADRILDLPLRVLPEGDRAVASIIINQASFAVVDWFADAIAAQARDLAPDVVVGLPTLGLTLAPRVAQRLGFENYVAMGYSRKFWYDEALSETVSSVTTPNQAKRLYLDPNLVPRLKGRRVVIVDDVVSRGTTVMAARRLLGSIGIETTAALTVMAQTERWRTALNGLELRAVFTSPAFERRAEGWWPI
ncbi:MAG: phosphoribosyltransferase [Rhodoplanes sp.]|nr:phosphoribosyltransferase [Rhodoplanes sp.]